MKIEELCCTNCGAPLKESEISSELKVARCSHCHSIFSIETERKTEEKNDSGLLVIPDHFKVSESEDHLEISWRWFRFNHVVMLIFSIPWTAFALFWTSMASRMSGAFSLLGIPFIAVGVGMFYSALSGLLNKTTLSVNRERLLISHGPMFWPMPPRIHPLNIRQFYCKETTSKNNNGSSFSYVLYAALVNGRQLKLISLDEYPQAHLLERKIEKFLNLEDRRVDGEYIFKKSS